MLFVCFFSFLLLAFVFLFIIKPLILSSQFILWLVISHKKVLPLRIYGSMSEVFLRKFLRNISYRKKYAVRKNSEASMKTIHTYRNCFQLTQSICQRRSQHPHKHLKWRPFRQLSVAFSQELLWQNSPC